MTVRITGVHGVFAVLLWLLAWSPASPALGEPPPRTVVRNATIVHLERSEEAPLERGRSIVIERGVITAIVARKDEDELRPGDLLVDAADGFVLPGFIEDAPAFDELPGRLPPSYATLARRLLAGTTTIAARWQPRRVAWFRTIEATASRRIPDLAAIDRRSEAAPSDAVGRRGMLLARTAGAAERLGLHERGFIRVGMRGDLVVFAADPREASTELDRPTQVVAFGYPLRAAELETGRAMIADADAAIDARPLPAAIEVPVVYDIESSGLRVGRLVVDALGRTGEEFWGPPIRETTAFTVVVDDAASGANRWRWSATQERSVARDRSETLGIEIASAAGSLRSTARVVGGELPPSTASIEATADEPLVDPVSFLLRLRSRMAPLAVGERLPLTVAEPVPQTTTVLIGVRSLALRRVAPTEAPVPAAADERVFALETGEGTPIIWAVLADDGRPRRVSSIAPEGVTEFLLPGEYADGDRSKSQPGPADATIKDVGAPTGGR
jgi:hypothetical protein